jgi:hypothetical protein
MKNNNTKMEVFCQEDDPSADFWHTPGCRNAKNINLMLIDWSGKVAYRVALTSVYETAWADVETSMKRVILG